MMRPGDLVRINWSDDPHSLFIVIELVEPSEEEMSGLEPGDLYAKLLEECGSIYETVIGPEEIRSGLFEVVQPRGGSHTDSPKV